MKERPILFSGSMVRAILEGRKTQTRRVVNPQPKVEMFALIGRDNEPTCEFAWVDYPRVISKRLTCPYGKPGDRLWVRENLRRPDGDPWLYTADNQPVMVAKALETAMLTWAHHKTLDYCPSIHMPRWACREVLEVTEVRVQRVQDISEEDAIAEGVEPWWVADLQPDGELREGPSIAYRAGFHDLWNAINGQRGFTWESNPWVWVVSFRRINAAERAA